MLKFSNMLERVYEKFGPNIMIKTEAKEYMNLDINDCAGKTTHS